ncbi:Glutamine amidotransferases class-II [Candidatus Rhodobacter oscarellae]|uniref:Glutamine amidotransferases class-II n=1 Tax=Candidatus Rhodobacter oscarellae TaxID=1675527 RepID=A0A0J9E4Z0_9RHOB|nr:class II glutamine amidotransferase [Candidatus Rhodobacter lobularis]KMW56874.1 Glutamine amidotransferases class-II [Candidatus Rhodobacter lobularis]
MCRWAAWMGAPMFLEEVISRPEHSLIAQSQRAEETKTAINADGFGAAWYNHRPEPGLYRDVHPAWSDANLAALAHQVRSPLFLVHVRASTGSNISRENCHPFTHGRWSFMHNGQVGGFDCFRKQADMLIDDAHYNARRGATDSEAIFLHALGLGLDVDPLGAMARAVGDLQDLSERHGQGPHMRFSAAFSDGARLYAVRYASDARAPSLYYRYLSDAAGYMVVSEPLDDAVGDWQAVPSGTALIFDGSSMETAAFAPGALRQAA